MNRKLFRIGASMVGGGLLALGLLGGACGSPGDSPEDCRADQYFEEASGRCALCPAPQAPICATDCGIEIFEDDRGCPAARCELGCSGVPGGEADVGVEDVSGGDDVADDDVSGGDDVADDDVSGGGDVADDDVSGGDDVSDGDVVSEGDGGE